jgi:amino acid adenylation domain-containing protein
MLAYERLAPVRFGDTVAEHRIIPSGTAVNDLTFFVQERGEVLHLGIEYRGDVLDEPLAQQLLDGFSDALAAVCHRPHRRIVDVRAVAEDLVGPPLALAEEDAATVLAPIVRWASADPDRPAVVESSGTAVSYGELLSKARGLAASLRARLGAPSRVGVSLGRSAGLVEAILGVQLAGASYVPIDPGTPSDRRSRLIALASLDAVVVDASTAPLFTGVPQIDISTIPIGDDVPIELPAGAAAAYVIFTSGSTGEPAGVEVSHANLASSTGARPAFYGAEAPSRFLLTPSIGFDSSMVGIYWSLVSGGSIVVPDDAEVRDVDRLGALIAAHEVTHLLMVPSLYRALLTRRADDLAGLRVAIVAGEACPADLVDEHHRRLPGTQLVNEYGPTEATVWATAHRCEPGDDPVPIGVPIAGSRVRIADEHQHSMAPGAAGELLIAGPGVVDRYLSGRSDSSFIEADGYRWYRTGDLARVDPGGRLVFLGRVDDQLNVGGYRIEPSEIEGHLARLAGVHDAVVVRATIDGRDSLVAHLVGDRSSVDVACVRAHVSGLVGPAAVPRRVVFHDELPRTANGKLDRVRAASLPIDEVFTVQVAGLLDVWRRALQRDDLDGDSDFFAEGGDSLAAVEIVTRVGELIGRTVAVSDLLAAPTPDALAARLGLVGGIATASPAISVLTLRAGSPSGPTIILTPAWDSVMGYRALAAAFEDDVRVLAVVVVAEGGGASTYPTVAALGSASIDIVAGELEQLGVSRVAVAGWSIGGVSAYDLGQRLAARGIEVSAVALVDTVFPGEHRHLWSNRWWKYKSLARAGQLGSVVEEFRVAAERRAKRQLAGIGRRLVAMAGEPVPPVQRITASGVPLTALDHVPGPTAVPVVLYAANTTNPARTEHPWRTVAPDLRVVRIEGRHRGFDSVMGADRVDQIADDLAAVVLAPQRST